MLVGKCTKCGKRYIGWALSKTEERKCPVCGIRLVVRNMSENHQPNTETAVAGQRKGIAEWHDEALESKKPNFML